MRRVLLLCISTKFATRLEEHCIMDGGLLRKLGVTLSSMYLRNISVVIA